MRLYSLVASLLGLVLLTAAVPLPVPNNEYTYDGPEDSGPEDVKCTKTGNKVLCVVLGDFEQEPETLQQTVDEVLIPMQEQLFADARQTMDEVKRTLAASKTSMEDYVQGCEVNDANSNDVNETTYNEDRRKRSANEEEDAAESESQSVEEHVEMEEKKEAPTTIGQMSVFEELLESREEVPLENIVQELEDDSNDRETRSAENSKESNSKSNEKSSEDNSKEQKSAGATPNLAAVPSVAPAVEVAEASPVLAAVPAEAPAVEIAEEQAALTEIEDHNDRERRSAENSKESNSKSNENSSEDNSKEQKSAGATPNLAAVPSVAPAVEVAEAAPVLAAVPAEAPAVEITEEQAALTEIEDHNDRERRSAENSKESNSKSNENSSEDNSKEQKSAGATPNLAAVPSVAPAVEVAEAAPVLAAVPAEAPAVEITEEQAALTEIEDHNDRERRSAENSKESNSKSNENSSEDNSKEQKSAGATPNLAAVPSVAPAVEVAEAAPVLAAVPGEAPAVEIAEEQAAEAGNTAAAEEGAELVAAAVADGA